MFLIIMVSSVFGVQHLVQDYEPVVVYQIFRSTPPSRPIKVGITCPSARPYVHLSKKVPSILMKFDM